MPQGSKLSEFERGRICELHKQGFSQRAIAAEFDRNKTVICNFVKDSPDFGAAKSTDIPNKNAPTLTKRIKLILDTFKLNQSSHKR